MEGTCVMLEKIVWEDVDEEDRELELGVVVLGVAEIEELTELDFDGKVNALAATVILKISDMNEGISY